MIARVLGVLAFVSVGLLGLLAILTSSPPIRAAIAVALAVLAAVPLSGLVALTVAGPLAPVLAVWVVAWGPFSRPVAGAAVVAAVGWPVAVARVVHRRSNDANGVDRAAGARLGDGHD